MSKANDQTLTFWLNNAGRYPVLKPEQVNDLVNRMNKLEKGTPRYTRLLNKVVNSNLRLVASIVCSYMKSKTKKQWGSNESLDYLQAGSMGLIQAAKNFDPDRGYKFSTYAYNWILCYLNRMSVHLTSVMKVSEEAYRASYNYKNKRLKIGPNCMTNEKAKELHEMVSVAQSMLSMDTRVADGCSIHDVVTDGTEPMSICYANEVIDDIQEHLSEIGISQDDIEVLVDVVLNGVRPSAIDRKRSLEPGHTIKLKRELINRIKKAGAPLSMCG